MQIVYLHGFASSPRSGKAQFLEQKCAEVGQELSAPDLNLGDFRTMTISKILRYLEQEFNGRELLAIGSSLGGFVAVQWAIRNPLISKLILLAPALNFPAAISQWLGQAGINEWKEKGDREFYHYSVQQHLPLSYEFYEDAQAYVDIHLERNLKITILHGKEDVVVPVQVSLDFQLDFQKKYGSQQSIELHLLDSDHSLSDRASLDLLWAKLQLAIKDE